MNDSSILFGVSPAVPLVGTNREGIEGETLPGAGPTFDSVLDATLAEGEIEEKSEHDEDPDRDTDIDGMPAYEAPTTDESLALAVAAAQVMPAAPACARAASTSSSGGSAGDFAVSEATARDANRGSYGRTNAFVDGEAKTEPAIAADGAALRGSAVDGGEGERFHAHAAHGSGHGSSKASASAPASAPAHARTAAHAAASAQAATGEAQGDTGGRFAIDMASPADGGAAAHTMTHAATHGHATEPRGGRGTADARSSMPNAMAAAQAAVRDPGSFASAPTDDSGARVAEKARSGAAQQTESAAAGKTGRGAADAASASIKTNGGNAPSLNGKGGALGGEAHASRTSGARDGAAEAGEVASREAADARPAVAGAGAGATVAARGGVGSARQSMESTHAAAREVTALGARIVDRGGAADAKAEAHAGAKAEAHAGAKADAHAEAKAEAKADAHAEVQDAHAEVQDAHAEVKAAHAEVKAAHADAEARVRAGVGGNGGTAWHVERASGATAKGGAREIEDGASTRAAEGGPFAASMGTAHASGTHRASTTADDATAEGATARETSGARPSHVIMKTPSTTNMRASGTASSIESSAPSVIPPAAHEVQGPAPAHAHAALAQVSSMRKATKSMPSAVGPMGRNAGTATGLAGRAASPIAPLTTRTLAIADAIANPGPVLAVDAKVDGSSIVTMSTLAEASASVAIPGATTATVDAGRLAAVGAAGVPQRAVPASAMMDAAAGRPSTRVSRAAGASSDASRTKTSDTTNEITGVAEGAASASDVVVTPVAVAPVAHAPTTRHEARMIRVRADAADDASAASPVDAESAHETTTAAAASAQDHGAAPEAVAVSPIVGAPTASAGAVTGVNRPSANASNVTAPGKRDGHSESARERGRAAAVASADRHALRRGVHAEVDLGDGGRLFVRAENADARVDVKLEAETSETARKLASHAGDLASELRSDTRQATVTVSGPNTSTSVSTGTGGGSANGGNRDNSNAQKPEQGDADTTGSVARTTPGRRARFVL